MKLRKTYKQKILKGDLNKGIIWGARSIKIEINNNCSPKLFDKELSMVISYSNVQFNVKGKKETWDNTDQIVPVSLNKLNNIRVIS